MNRLVRRAAHVVAALALGAGALFALGAAPAGAADPLGYVILQGEGQCALASVDLVTGATTEIGTEAANKCVWDLEFTPDGSRLYGVRITDAESESGGTAELVEFNLSTGAVSDVSPLGDFPIGGPGTEQGNLTFTPGGSVYTYLVPFTESPEPRSTALDPACDGSSFCLFNVDLTDPTNLNYVNSVPQQGTVYFGLATSCAGVTSSVRSPGGLDAAGAWSSAASQVQPEQVLTTVNRTSTGPGTADVGGIGSSNEILSLDYDSAGTLYAVGYTESGAHLFTVDPATGTTTDVSALNNGTDPINFGVLGFAIAHPCTAPPPPPPTPAPQVVVAPRFTG